MKKSRFIIAVLVVIFIGFTISCEVEESGIGGDGTIEKKERIAKDFDSIVLDGVGDVYVYIAEDFKVEVMTDANLQSSVLTNVESNVLHISLQFDTIIHATMLEINVYLPELKSISISKMGVGNIYVDNGKTQDLEITLAGTGHINTLSYEVENINISHTGVGSARIWATKSMRGVRSGVGDIWYKGHPENNINSIGIRSVRPISGNP